MKAGHFHAGLPPETRKSVQDSFINGDLRAIVATNAFGMGIDKPDVRLVIHADIPGSLENYLQEAGRAGRDQRAARCVLLYTLEDVERQFGMSARSRLSRQEIQGVLKALRNLDRRKRTEGEVVATSGEILGEDEDNAFGRDSATDDTRLRTAVAWLEEAVLLTREENRVQVFPSSLRVGSVGEARAKLEQRKVPVEYRRQLLSICETLIEADADEGISTDELMSASGLTSEGVRKALYDLEEAGIASDDTALTAFVHAGVERSSRRRFEQAAAMEEALIDLMREAAPDMGRGDASTLHLRLAAQQLKDDGHSYALPERSEKDRGEHRRRRQGRGRRRGKPLGAEPGCGDLSGDPASGVEGAGEDGRVAPGRSPEVVGPPTFHYPQGNQGHRSALAETTLGELLTPIKRDRSLRSQVRDPDKLRDRALLWLHEQEVIRLNKGLAVFRPAMTIRLKPERRGFAEPDFRPLKFHYDEQVLQIHVMSEYAEQGLESMADALTAGHGLLYSQPGGLSEPLVTRPAKGNFQTDHAGVLANHPSKT